MCVGGVVFEGAIGGVPAVGIDGVAKSGGLGSPCR
jgi:hypothetical protein